ncbi:MAG: hypothetical protein IT373_23825 [Polyangiaceae bacterium]|nr:hypothetical protein [Polyangiaceae bacterium]
MMHIAGRQLVEIDGGTDGARDAAGAVRAFEAPRRTVDSGPGRSPAWVAAVGVVLCLGCGRRDESEAQLRVFTAEGEGCRLSVAVERLEEERFVFSYTFTNTSDRSAYFFDQIEGGWDRGAFVVGGRHAVFVSTDGSGVVLSKRIPTIPPDGPWPESASGPFATRVAPGGREERMVDLQLPLPYYNPHVSIEEDDRDPMRALSSGRAATTSVALLDAVFVLGFELMTSESDRFLEERHRRTASDGRSYFDWRLSSPDRQSLLRVGPIAALPILLAAPIAR